MSSRTINRLLYSHGVLDSRGLLWYKSIYDVHIRHFGYIAYVILHLSKRLLNKRPNNIIKSSCSITQFSIPNRLVRQMLQKDPEIRLSPLKRRKVEKRRHPHIKRPSIIVSV